MLQSLSSACTHSLSRIFAADYLLPRSDKIRYARKFHIKDFNCFLLRDPVNLNCFLSLFNWVNTQIGSLIRILAFKANRTFGFLRRTLFSCPQDVKEAAYKGMVCPVLEYGSSVWDPNTPKLQDELEKVQNHAARFVTRNYVYETGSMTGILGQLKWESLKKRRKANRLILLYKGLKGKARIPTNDLIPKVRLCRNQHSMAFQVPSASIDAYRNSFFPRTIRDCVSKFTSLLRARD